jgi:hypothetical protein
MGEGRSSRKSSSDEQSKERTNLSISQHKELSVGTLSALIRSAGMCGRVPEVGMSQTLLIRG